MDTKKEIEALNELIGLDYDAVSAYESAIKGIHEEPIRAQLRQFQDDHRRHITELSAAVRTFGGKPRESTDVKGFFIKSFTAITSSMGTEAALMAMRGNEKLTTKNYSEARNKDFSAAVKPILERGWQDETRHLSWIEQAIQGRIWESGTAHP
jgi:uncharacterized protein (TIGR02284 family)